ncbi:MAG: MmgE/PrpD family protein [Pseudonocardia sp.]|nr:MmgE/PrpD family protein [Pseudonocardia sp.]
MSHTTVPPVTRQLAEYAATADLADLPDEVRELAADALVDTVGVALAGRNEDAVRMLRVTLGRDGAHGEATVLLDGSRADAPTAALVNATAGHALDYDDVTDLIYGHPSVVLWPAVLAAGERAGASGRALVEAYVVGFEVQCAVAAAMSVREHYGRGWHSSATIGVLGAAAASARLLGLDVDAASRALGLAASMAGGSRQNFGTMTKPLHPGLAARDGVFAAMLAGAGFTADTAQLESPLGYFAMYADGCDLERVQASLAGPWALTEHGLNVKKYPCCYCTHRTADATLELAARDGIDPAEVRSIRLTLEPGGFDPLIHHRPTTGLEGKFSAEYVIATALLDGRVGLASFTDDAVRRPRAQELLRKVEIAEHERPPLGPAEWTQAYAVLEIDTTADRHFLRVDVPRGHCRLPMERSDLEAKFRDCVSFSGVGWDADSLLAALWKVEVQPPYSAFTLTGERDLA